MKEITNNNNKCKLKCFIYMEGSLWLALCLWIKGLVKTLFLQFCVSMYDYGITFFYHLALKGQGQIEHRNILQI